MADACEGADLLVIEGMGRAIHTNLRTRFRCDCLKLAMVKARGGVRAPGGWQGGGGADGRMRPHLLPCAVQNQRLAEALFGGQQFDCICLFEPAVGVDRSR